MKNTYLNIQLHFKICTLKQSMKNCSIFFFSPSQICALVLKVKEQIKIWANIVNKQKTLLICQYYCFLELKSYLNKLNSF